MLHLYVVFVQYPIDIALAPITCALHDFSHAIASFVHVDDQAVAFQFSFAEIVGVTFCLNVVVRILVPLGKNPTDHIQDVRRALFAEQHVAGIYLVRNGNDPDVRPVTISNEEHHVVEIAERMLKRIEYSAISLTQIIDK